MAKNLVGETMGSEGSGDPFLWTQFAQQACDTICQDTDAYGGTASFDTVQNQSLYCGPNTLYHINDVYYTDSSNQSVWLTPGILDDLNDRYGPGVQGPGTPRWYVTQGMNNIIIYPVPATTTFVFAFTDLIVSSASQFQVSSAGERTFQSTDQGLVIYITSGTGWYPGIYPIVSVSSGVATVAQPIGTVTATGGTGRLSQGGVTMVGFLCPDTSWGGTYGTSTYNPTAICPLHPVAHMAVVYGAALLRAKQHYRKDVLLVQGLMGDYKEQMNRLNDANGRFTPATRHDDRQFGRFRTGYY